jgi:hypothetical protein
MNGFVLFPNTRLSNKLLHQLYVFAAGLSYSSDTHDPAFEVVFIAWEVFRDKLLTEKEKYIRHLRSQDISCFIGGPDYQSNLK